MQAGLWRRNGTIMVRQAMYYRNRFWHDTGLDLDIFAVQCATLVCGGDFVVRT